MRLKVYGEAEFSDGAHWVGCPVSSMSKDLLRGALAYKIKELQYCYAQMTVDQARAVAEKMKDVPVPIEMPPETVLA